MQKKRFLVSIFLCLSLIVLGGVYYGFFQKRSEIVRDNAVNQRSSAQQEIVVSAVSSSTKLGARIPLSAENIEKFFSDICDTKNNFRSPARFYNDPADSSVLYRNTDKGLSVKFPYNERWGTEKYQVLPYDENEGWIRFGQMAISGEGGCSIYRRYNLRFLPPENSEEVRKRLQKDEYELNSEISAEKINNLEAIFYKNSGLCDIPILEVIGKKSNYEFSGWCYVTTFEDLRNIADTILIN